MNFFFLHFQLNLLRVGNFDANPLLLSLSMANNFITTIPANTFIALVNLESLDLGNNQLEILPGTLLRNNVRLVSLGLRRNNISAIQSTFFNNLERLVYLNLLTNSCINRYFSIYRQFSVDVTPHLEACYANF